MEYTKIPNIFKREEFGKNRIIEGEYATPELEYLANVPWVWTEKVDGCLRSFTKLTQTNGEEISIKDVVENKISAEIYGFDGERVVPTKVVGWHKNGLTDEWYVVKVERRGLGTKGGNSYRTIWCTGNHKFYVDGEYIMADKLGIGDTITFLRNYKRLSYQQEQIITGLLVGDGSAADGMKSVEFSHKKDHEEYVDWILSSLGSISGHKGKKRISGYGTEMIPGRTISCLQVNEFCENFYKDGKKIIPRDIKLGPISLAVIYMDDGALTCGEGQIDRCSISLNDYDEESVDNLVMALESQMHITAVKYQSKGWNIRLNAENFEKLQILVSPYVCGCMQYKLSKQYRSGLVPPINESDFGGVCRTLKLKVLEIEKKKETHERYDITTETHNYFANGVLVHNCNIRVIWDGHAVFFGGRTENAQIPSHLVNKLNDLFGGTNKEEIFEQKFGETKVILFGEGFGEKIQKGGGLYGPVDFILFDVFCGGMWLKRDSMEDIANTFGIRTVPIVGTGTLPEAVEYVRQHPHSKLREAEMEGVVCRPLCELSDRRGNRLIVKVKCRDFEES